MSIRQNKVLSIGLTVLLSVVCFMAVTLSADAATCNKTNNTNNTNNTNSSNISNIINNSCSNRNLVNSSSNLNCNNAYLTKLFQCFGNKGNVNLNSCNNTSNNTNNNTNTGSSNNTNNTANVTGNATAEQQMLTLINNARAESGLKALTLDASLTKLARLKSQDMITNNYFDHNSPTYGTPSQMLSKYGISYSMSGENIAINRNVAGAHTALMNSSGHRANIMHNSYTHIGLGIVSNSNGSLYITQIFIKK